MGLTSVTIGHATDKINNAVIQEINKGVNFSKAFLYRIRIRKGICQINSTARQNKVC